MRRVPHVRLDGSIEWPKVPGRDGYDALLVKVSDEASVLVKVADEAADEAALELLHRDCIRATITWNRFLDGSFVLPRSCIGGTNEREVEHVLGVIGRALG